MTAKDDVTFGRAAIELGLCTVLQVRECLLEQERLRQQGAKVLLGRLLVEYEYIREEDVARILDMQDRREVICEQCGQPFAASPLEPQILCPWCGQKQVSGRRTAAGPPPDSSEGATFRLIFHLPGTGHMRMERQLIPGQSLSVGRGSQADLRVDDPAMSRQHCRFSVEDAAAHVEDMGSHNGTLLNGEPIFERSRIGPHDEICLGDTRVRAVRGAATEPPLAPPSPHSPASGSHPADRTDTPRRQPVIDLQTCQMCGNLLEPGDVSRGAARLIAGRLCCPECVNTRLFPGRELGGYALERRIGHGGMAEVWRARHVSSGEVAAVKVLLISRKKINPQSLKRFLKEAEAGSRLDHPGLPRIFAHGTSDSIPYIAMEYVEGVSLAKRLDEEGRLPRPEAIHIGIEIARVLAYAHSMQVIHRDVKPANIIVDAKSGIARLLDLGVVKFAHMEASELTKTGTGLGTLEYAPPEQLVDAKRVDHRADIYSLGATLYRMVCGHRPFRGRAPLEIARAIVQDPVPWSEEDIDLAGPELRALIDRCMAKRPDGRPASVTELEQALTALLA